MTDRIALKDARSLVTPVYRLWRDNTRGELLSRGIEAKFSFNFGNWRAPDREGFGALRVLNEDRIVPGAGFAWHGHDNLEILMMPLSGAIAHEDSLGLRDVIEPDEVLMMSAGAGIHHSQFNARTDRLDHHLQIWIEPRQKGTAPRVDKRRFPAADRVNRWQTIASEDGRDGSLIIDQDAIVWRALVLPGQRLTWSSAAPRRLFLHTVSGLVTVRAAETAAEELLTPGDAWLTDQSRSLVLQACAGPASDLLLIELPPA